MLSQRIASGLAAAALLLCGANCSASSPTTVPSTWSHYDMIINLDHLSKQYSCDDLWYKFRDVLQALGAQEISQVMPYDCGPAAADHGLSPKVEVAFELPDKAAGIPLRYVPMQARDIDVHLSPGQPPKLDASDCDLVRQIDNTLIQAIPLHVISANWHCKRARPAQSHYELTLQVLTPAPQPVRQARSGGATVTPHAS